MMAAELPFLVIATGLPPMAFQQMGDFVVADFPDPGQHPLLTFSLTQAIPEDKSGSLG